METWGGRRQLLIQCSSLSLVHSLKNDPGTILTVFQGKKQPQYQAKLANHCVCVCVGIYNIYICIVYTNIYLYSVYMVIYIIYTNICLHVFLYKCIIKWVLQKCFITLSMLYNDMAHMQEYIHIKCIFLL